MRENCTYGSMRGRAYPITRGVPLYSTPSESHIGNCSDLGNALTRLGYSEEGHFGGLRKVNDVVLLSKQLKKR